MTFAGRTALTVGLAAAALMAREGGALLPVKLSGMEKAFLAACPHRVVAVQNLAELEATMSAALTEQKVPSTEDLLDLACVRLKLLPGGSPPADEKYLTTPHSSWGSAALHAALRARALAPENVRALRLLARIAVVRSGGRYFAGEDDPRRRGKNAADLPLTGPPPDVFAVLDDLLGWTEAAGNRDETVSEGCVSLALDLARYAQAHRCAVVGITKGHPPAWHLLRLAWLDAIAGRDSMAASAEVDYALDIARPALDWELAYLSGADRFSSVRQNPPNWIAGLRSLAPRGWSIMDWRRGDVRTVSSERSHAAEVVATGSYLRDPVSGMPILLIVARRGDDSARAGAAGTLLQWWLTTEGVVSRVDSLIVPDDSTVAASFPALRLETGIGGWDLIFRHEPLNGAGAWDDRLPQSDDGGLRLTDLLLGGGEDDAQAVIGLDTVRVSPHSPFSVDSVLRLTFEVWLATATNAASVQLNIFRTDRPTGRNLRLEFAVRLEAGEVLLTHEIDLSSVDSGQYVVRVTVTDSHSGATASRAAAFIVDR